MHWPISHVEPLNPGLHFVQNPVLGLHVSQLEGQGFEHSARSATVLGHPWFKNTVLILIRMPYDSLVNVAYTQF